MPRKSKTTELDLRKAIEITAGDINRLKCPEGRDQAFLRDTKSPGLKVRVTMADAKAFVFEGKLHGQTIRRTIGDPRAWSLTEARVESNRLKVMLDEGKDPRDVDRQRLAEFEAKRSEAVVRELKVGEVWSRYLIEGKPKKKEKFKKRYLEDLKVASSPGGLPWKRGKGVTRVGPIYPLLSLPLASIDDDVLKIWQDKEAIPGRDQATRALMMFRGFLRWSSEQPEYRELVDLTAGKSAAILNSIPSARGKRRRDSIEAGQIAVWWHALDKHGTPTSRDYLRALVLTGARREEMAALTWKNVNFKWNRITTADKVGVARTFPISQFLAALLSKQPRKGAYVFHGQGKCDHIVNPKFCFNKSLDEAEIGHVTIHGLRRTFSRLSEDAGAPNGAVQQIMGHATQDTAEDYRWRSFTALSLIMDQIETHILKLAKVSFKRTRLKKIRQE